MDNHTKELLKDVSVALTDWLHTYAPEFCDENSVVETRKRIKKRGGTIAYIADLKHKVEEKLDED